MNTRIPSVDFDRGTPFIFKPVFMLALGALVMLCVAASKCWRTAGLSLVVGNAARLYLLARELRFYSPMEVACH